MKRIFSSRKIPLFSVAFGEGGQLLSSDNLLNKLVYIFLLIVAVVVTFFYYRKPKNKKGKKSIFF